MRLKQLATATVMMLAASGATARDNGQWEETTPETREWYRTLMQPDNPRVSCCGEADAYWADKVEVVGEQVYAIITDTRDDMLLRRPHIAPGTRVLVPNEKLKFDQGNPTGHSVIFMNTGLNVFCFVQSTGI